MARITVEDCIQKVENHFELVILAAQRARQLSSGAPLTVERDNDKNPVIALREIADDTISIEQLRTAVLTNFKQKSQTFDVDNELSAIYDEEQERQFEESLMAEAALAETSVAVSSDEMDEDFGAEDEYLPEGEELSDGE